MGDSASGPVRGDDRLPAASGRVGRIPPDLSRRTFLRGVVAGGAALFAACGSQTPAGPASPAGSSAPTAGRAGELSH